LLEDYDTEIGPRFNSGSGRKQPDRATGLPPPITVPPPPDSVRPPRTNPPPTVPRDPTDRLADVLKDLFSQQIVIPSSGQPVVVPTPTSRNSIIPVLLITVGVGIAGYVMYKKKGGTRAD
jgi:hypothetical protein